MLLVESVVLFIIVRTKHFVRTLSRLEYERLCRIQLERFDDFSSFYKECELRAYSWLTCLMKSDISPKKLPIKLIKHFIHNNRSFSDW